jgi:hypothetical protein
MVFDNIETINILSEARPLTGPGRILVTCRSEFLSSSFTAKTVEIPTFTTQEGSQLLLKIIGQDDPSEDEKKCALELSERLGGLALAIDIIGRQIKVPKKSLAQFLPFYDENRVLLKRQPPRGITNQYYSMDLDTVWKTAFLSLTENAANLLRLICFVAPDDIPDFLFTDGKGLPEHLAFIKDPVQ